MTTQEQVTKSIIQHYDKAMLTSIGDVIHDLKHCTKIKEDDPAIKVLRNRLNELMFKYVRRYAI